MTDWREIVAAADIERLKKYAEHAKWRGAYAVQLSNWLQPAAHELAANVWWGAMSEDGAYDRAVTIALNMTLKAKTATLFDWRETTFAVMEETLAAHGARHGESFALMKSIAGDALKQGSTRQQAAFAVAAVARQRAFPPPPYLISDAVEFAEKEIFFADLRGKPKQFKRKNKARAR